MEKLQPQTDGASLGIVQQNIEELKRLFPEVVTEGKIDFDALREVLGDYVDENEERYCFTWNGKAQARRVAQREPSTGTLRPCPDRSVAWADTGNAFLEGESLQVLKLLQKSYHRKVKLIYVDPPYNTGSDSFYPGIYPDSLDTYLRYAGLVSGDRLAFSANADTSGTVPLASLSMMYPRLLLSRNLLRKDDGYCVVCIDDCECHNLRRLLDEVFGEENHLATLVIEKNRKNNAQLFSVGHDYTVVYAKNKALLSDLGTRLRMPKDGVQELKELFARLREQYGEDWEIIKDGLDEHFATFDPEDPRRPLMRFTKVDEKGPYRTDGDISWPGGGGPRYDVPHPVTGRNCKVPSRGWVWPSYGRMKEEIDAGNVVFGPDETTIPSRRRSLFEADDQVMRSVAFSYAQTTVRALATLFDGKQVYENPKDPQDICRLIEYLTGPDDTVLDLFGRAGSAAHAVLQANATSGTRRRLICVQLPEPFETSHPAGKLAYELCTQLRVEATVASLACERIRRTAAAIYQEEASPAADCGFRYFRLDSTNVRPWDPAVADVGAALFDLIDNIKEDRSERDLLYEVLLKYGLDLNIDVQEHEIDGKRVFVVGAGALIASFEAPVTADLLDGIVSIENELNPVYVRVLFRDSAFQNDVVKTNAMQRLAQASISDIRSI